MMDRRKFLQALGATAIFVACGKEKDPQQPVEEDDTVLFRFAVASDLHYGEANTNYESYTANFIKAFNDYNKQHACEFVVLNGDIIHNSPSFLPLVHTELKKLETTLYATQGNHDRVSDEVWKNTWGQEVNFDFSVDDMAFVFGTTSDQVGSLKCPDLTFLTSSLNKYKNKKHVFIFWHIHPHSPSMGCTEAVKNVMKDFTNVRGVFNGHDHNLESIQTVQAVPYMFDGRLGGSWGSFDRNFRIVEITKSEIVTYLMTPNTRKMLNRFKV